jgi:hypothetical protein
MKTRDYVLAGLVALLLFVNFEQRIRTRELKQALVKARQENAGLQQLLNSYADELFRAMNLIEAWQDRAHALCDKAAPK